jgi:ABC-type transport system involved in cytochrome bd biosynthesis fused ATPase/permease subunit
MIGGWDVLQGMQLITIGWILVYGLFAWYVVRWNRGVLPVISALAILMLIFGLVAMPAWFDRDAPGFAETSLSAGLLGTLTALLVAIQALLIFFAMQGFRQAWNVEVEHWPDEEPDYVPAGA